MTRRAVRLIAAAVIAAAALLVPSAAAVAATTGNPHPGIEQVGPDAPASPPTDPHHPATIRYRDSSGAITSVWHGSQAQAAQISADWRTGSTAGTVSPAIQQPPHCNPPTTYWVFYAAFPVCYRYSGTLSIHISGVYEVDSGNNAGYYTVGGVRYYISKYDYDLWDPTVTVTKIHIN